MKKAKKLFGETNMTWLRVLGLAAITGVVTGILAQIDFLNDTSFEDPAVLFDVWFLFAVFIVVNCKTWWEAALKCFVFFLVSQPIIYLVQVPFFDRGWEIFGYYRYWFFITLLTLPGAAVAFLVKKKNWLSVAILSVATSYLAYACIYYFRSVTERFPRHLLSCIFCLALAIFFVFVLLDQKKHRIAALAVIAAVLAASLYLTGGRTPTGYAEVALEEGSWVCTAEDDSIVSVTITDENIAEITGRKNGYTALDFENEDGTVKSFSVVVNGKNLQVGTID